MNVGITEATLAIVTMDKAMKSSIFPVFYADNEKELQERALLISKTMGAMVHDVLHGTLIIVKH
ncbi:MAG: capping complex subunit for YIEGIA [Paraclostridium sp.]